MLARGSPLLLVTFSVEGTISRTVVKSSNSMFMKGSACFATMATLFYLMNVPFWGTSLADGSRTASTSGITKPCLVLYNQLALGKHVTQPTGSHISAVFGRPYSVNRKGTFHLAHSKTGKECLHLRAGGLQSSCDT